MIFPWKDSDRPAPKDTPWLTGSLAIAVVIVTMVVAMLS